ncbi:MAG: phage terminase large subunit, partial [Clostridia bacterium]
MKIRIAYQPTEKQALFHASMAQEVLYGGAAGGGKSYALVMDAFARCVTYAGTHAFLFRRTFRELEDTLIDTALRVIPRAAAAYNVARRQFRFGNGSVMHFCHCACEQDKLSYQGAEMHWLYIDELTHFSKTMYDYFKTRLRANKALGIEPVVRCASNPGGPGHGWVKAYFVDIGTYGQVHRRVTHSDALEQDMVSSIQYIPALATDNPHITKAYLFELERKPRPLREALLYGRWDAFEGQAFTEFRDDPTHYDDGRSTHVITPFALPASWPRYRSFDFGYTAPFSVGWWAAAPDGRVYRYREWYGCMGTPGVGLQITPEEIAQGILRREEEERADNLCVTGLADPSIYDVSRGESIAEKMQKQGVYFRPADNARLHG